MTVVQDAEFRARRDLLGGRRAGCRAELRPQCAADVMPTARHFHDPDSTLEYALEIAPQGGMALEFGVFQGRSLR